MLLGLTRVVHGYFSSLGVVSRRHDSAMWMLMDEVEAEMEDDHNMEAVLVLQRAEACRRQRSVLFVTGVI